MEFSPDGKSLAIGFRSTMVEVWNVERPEFLRRIPNQLSENNRMYSLGVGSPYSFSYSPDGTTMAYGDTFGGGAAILKADTGELLQEFSWDLSTGKQLSDHNSGGQSCEWVAFSPDGKTLAVGGLKRGNNTKSVKLVDVETGKEIARFEDRYGPVRFSPDGEILAIGGYRGLSLIDLVTKRIRFDKPSSVRDLAFSSNSAKLAIGDADGNVELRNAKTGMVIWKTRVAGYWYQRPSLIWMLILALASTAFVLLSRWRQKVGQVDETPAVD